MARSHKNSRPTNTSPAQFQRNPAVNCAVKLPYRKQPVHIRLQGFKRNCGIELGYKQRRAMLVDEMTGSFIGAMPPREFLKTFLKHSDDTAPLPGKCDFSKIHGDMKLEADMYPIICKEIKKAKVFPGFKLETVANASEDGIPIRPDLAAVPNRTPFEPETAFNTMEFWVEVKPRKSQDAFAENTAFTHLEKSDGDSVPIRGQLISYAAALMSRQQRLFAFSLIIFGHFARLCRWDRSACVVSDLFDFYEDPDILALFFWCYSRLSREERGFDPTVKVANAKETETLKKAIDRFRARCHKKKRHHVLAVQKPNKPEPQWPTFKIEVKIGNDTHNLLVGRPFWDADSDSPCGRATRGYLAYDLTDKKLIFLKDSWRTEDSVLMSEEEIYKRLREHNVPHLPEVIAAGDVESDGKPQQTTAQEYSNTSPEWLLAGCSQSMRKMLHNRVLQQICYPLKSARSSKEMVQVLFDVIETIIYAHDTAGILHRDVSVGNIMIDEEGHGILNDWDHAMNVRNSKKRHPSRTGTWQFLSISLLQGAGLKIHEIQDDLESCYWALLYISFHYFKHNSTDFSLKFFDEYEGAVNNRPPSGGNLKFSLLALSTLRKVRWDCKPLNDLIHKVTYIFTKYHRAASDLPIRETEEFLNLHAELGRATALLDCFKTALDSEEWPEYDTLDDQMPPVSENQAEKNRLKTLTRALTNQHNNQIGNRREQSLSGDEMNEDSSTTPENANSSGIDTPTQEAEQDAPMPEVQQQQEQENDNEDEDRGRKRTKRVQVQPPRPTPQHRYGLRSRGKRDEPRKQPSPAKPAQAPNPTHTYVTRSRTKAGAQKPASSRARSSKRK